MQLMSGLRGGRNKDKAWQLGRTSLNEREAHDATIDTSVSLNGGEPV
jgi:hypothetical protein